MRTLTLAAALMLALPALATNNPPPAAVPAPAATATSRAAAGAKADADAAARARSSAGGATVSGDTGDTTLAILPALVHTPPLPLLPATSCISTHQESLGVAFGLVSHAVADQSSDNCVAIILYNAAVSTCRYASARQIADLLTVKVLPGFQAPRTPLADLTPEQCEVVKTPPPVVAVRSFIDPPCAAPPVRVTADKRPRACAVR